MELVLNWIWQGIVIACATAALLRLVAPANARLRYGLLWASLAAIVLLPLVPLVATASATFAALPAASPLAVPARPIVTLAAPAPSADRTVILLCGLWVLAAAWQLARAGAALRRARRHCIDFPPDVERRLGRWSTLRASGRQTRLALSNDVRSAGVLPGAEPWIALSPRLLDTLTDGEIDRILVHEWAHVQRYDDRAHVLQAIVSACVGWHPAVWWCGRRLHLEREMACDEMAVALTGSRKAYAACLAKLAALPVPSAPPLPIVAAVSASGVRRRVVRILSSDAGTAGPGRAVAAALAAVALVAMAPYVSGFRIVAASAEDPGARASAWTPADGDRPDRAAPQDDDRATDAAPDTARVDPGPSAVTSPVAAGASVSTAAARVSGIGRRAPVPADRPSPPARRAAQNDGNPPGPTGRAPTAAHEAVAEPLHARVLPAAALGGVPVTTPVAGPAEAEAAPGPDAAAPWDAAVAGGRALSRGSRDAGVAAAGFFSRVGRRLAGSF